MSLIHLVKRKFVVRNLILVLALFIVLASSSFLSVSAFGIASPQPAISPLKGGYPKTLTSPHPQSNGEFGYSVAISGKLAIVGAWLETAGGYSEAGHAYIYNATTWKLIQNLTSPNAQDYGYFGISISISGNFAMVGAPGETASGFYSDGDAYVFNAITGKVIQSLTSPNQVDDGVFGWSVAISAKLAIVGAPGETSTGGLWAGNVYVYNIATGKLIKTLTSPNSQEGGYFGSSVSITGKLVIIGAPDESVGELYYAGNAYIFNAVTGKVIQSLSSPNAQDWGLFGSSVAIIGKLAIVGAPWETPDGYAEAGHAYAFK